VECADDAAFEDASEVLNRIRMYRTDDVLPLGVVDSAMHEECVLVAVQ
jgi:hypothetical protein